MKKLLFLFMFLAAYASAQTLMLDKQNSQVYYEAKKTQFFMDFDVIGVNKSLKGDLQKIDDEYKGMLYIDSAKFASGNSIRDAHVREDYLRSEEFPYLRFDFTIKNNIAKGIMLISGVPKQIEFPVELIKNDKSLLIKGSIKIKYSEFGIRTPSNFIVSADENIVIGANLNFKK